MSSRASTSNLVLSLAAYLLFVIVLGGAAGFGVGTVELLIWLGVLAIGASLITRRYRRARAAEATPPQSAT